MVIPRYPDFKPLDITDLHIFNHAFTNLPPQISEFTFTNLYSWRQAYKLQVCLFDDFLIVRSDSAAQARFFSPIGNGDIKSAIERILKENGGTFLRIPEPVAALFEHNQQVKVELDRDNSDYLFKAEDLISLTGKKYDGKRNLIKKFQSMHEYEYVTFDASSINECLEFEENWCVIKECDGEEGLRNEREALKEMVAHFSVFKLIAGGIRVGGKIAALAIGQQLNPTTLVLHVLKADPHMAGLYQLITHEFLLREGNGFAYVNMEQDLGVEGLRKAKLSYHPVGMVKKYTLGMLRE